MSGEGGGGHPPYQTGKTVHVHTNTQQTQGGWMHGAGCVWSQCFVFKSEIRLIKDGKADI